jgi:excinuclease ABC subunit C
MYSIARLAFPNDYGKRLRLRLPWFLTLTGDTFPRLSIGGRNGSDGSPVFGPFTSREAAVRYQESVESLFQIRRCTDTWQPHPDHPGCIYGEMNLCLRPCQMAVSPDEYRAEATRVATFLASDPTVPLRQLTVARDRAAEELDFEYASELHRQREKMAAAVDSRPELSSEVSRLSGLAVTNAAQPGTFWLRPLHQGCWHKPVLFSLEGEASRNTSLDSRIREVTGTLNDSAREEGDRSEHLALLTRWFYSTYRSGEWFPVQKSGDYPIRRLAGGISRLAKTALTT